MTPNRKSFAFGGGPLFVCDMRPGFSEDGIVVTLPSGEYELSLDSLPSGLTGFSLILVGKTPDKYRTKGRMEIDMARVGVFDRAAFTRIFAGDSEALFDWSDAASGRKSASWGGFLHHRASGQRAFYVNTGSDGTCSVQILLSRGRPVGVRVIPQAPDPAPPQAIKLQQYVFLEVKCRGIGPPWAFGGANDQELRFDDVLDEVLQEVSLDDITFEVIDPDSIDPDAPISQYQPRFKGVSRIEVFQASDGTHQRKRLSVLSSPKLLPSQATSRQLAKLVYDLIQNGRERT